MSIRGKPSKRKILYGLVFLLILFLLAGGGWLVKNNIILRIRSLGIGRRGWLRPMSQEGIEERLERELKELALKEGLKLIDRPVVEETSLVATFSGQLTCLLNLEKDIFPQLASLQFILWRSKIEGKELKSIDLRFEKPVVKY